MLGGLLLVLFTAIIFGLMAASGIVLISLIPLLGVIVVLLSFRPWLFTWITLVAILVVLGTLRLYFPGLQYLRWLVPIACAGVLLAMLISQSFHRAHRPSAPLPALFIWVAAFAVYGLVATLLNWTGMVPAILGVKNYFQVWTLLLIFTMIHFRGYFIHGFIVFLLAIAFLQLPLVLHQLFVVVPSRPILPGLFPHDVIAGSFGADMDGGGNNALLSAYLVMSVGLLISMWQQKILKAWLLALGAALLIFPVFLNESKVSFFYIWIMFLVLFREDIAKNPLRFIVGNIALGLFLIFFLYMYTLIAHASGQRVSGVLDYLDYIYFMNVKTSNQLYGLTRFTALSFWFLEHFPGDVLHAFIGHGLGQTQEAGVLSKGYYNTIAGRLYPGLHIGVSALSAMLWDVGLIGVTIACMMFASAFRLAGRLAGDWAGEPAAVALFRALQAAIAILFITIPHKNLFVLEITEQGLFILLVGFLIYSARHTPRQVLRPSG